MSVADTMPSFLGPFADIRIKPRRSLLTFFLAARPTHLSPPFRLEKQDQTEWCWAAVASAVHHYMGSSRLPQCEVAELIRPNDDCCARPSSRPCNKPASLASILARLGNRRSLHAGSLVPEVIRTELASHRPICCGLAGGGRGHFVVITGCSSAQGTIQVTIKDPAIGNSPKTVNYAHLRSGYRSMAWRETYLTKGSAS